MLLLESGGTKDDGSPVGRRLTEITHGSFRKEAFDCTAYFCNIVLIVSLRASSPASSAIGERLSRERPSPTPRERRGPTYNPDESPSQQEMRIPAVSTSHLPWFRVRHACFATACCEARVAAEETYQRQPLLNRGRG